MDAIETPQPVVLAKVRKWEHHTTEDRASFVAGLRKMADFFEQTDAPLPWGMTVAISPHEELRFPHNLPDAPKARAIKGWLRDCARRLRWDRPTPGTVEKTSTEYGYYVSRVFNPEVSTFGPKVKVQFSASNDICEVVDTGEVETKEVTEIPDEVKAQYTHTVEVPVTKRVCAPLLEDV